MNKQLDSVGVSEKIDAVNKILDTLTEREKTEDTLVRNNNTLGKLNAYNNMKRDREHNINNILKFENNIERLKELSNNDDIVLDNYTTL